MIFGRSKLKVSDEGSSFCFMKIIWREKENMGLCLQSLSFFTNIAFSYCL